MSERNEREKYFSTREEKFRSSKRPCNSIIIVSVLFPRVKRNMLSSRMKISCFRAKTHLVFD